MNNNNTFIPLIFRMKYINRWGLKFNTQTENVMQHTAECAFIAHFLALVGNRYFGKSYDANKLAVAALFHDATEIMTGDLPTPIKYFNNEMQTIYKQIEQQASEKMLEHLPHELQADYDTYLNGTSLSEEERDILKIADRLCAYIKCIHEINAGNNEFSLAHKEIKEYIENIDSQELRYFLDNCLAAFSQPLDDLKAKL
ncbi:MAG: 5'-deoxynucleotidase [Defluviitaleaceae bacterium]|nr:5'-deoxynucleotidase [Defluviitaleaceae bacterium]